MARIFILALLIVLLPLRGWTAERMAEHMAASSLHAAVPAAMPADCPMVHMVDPSAVDPSAAVSDGSGTSAPDHQTCQSCQLCMSLAAHGIPAVQTASPAPQTVAVHPADRFASADPWRSTKPPIS